MIFWQFIGNQLSGKAGFPLRLLSWWHNSWDGIIKCKMYTVCKIRYSLTSCTAAQENTQKLSVYLHFSLGQTLEQHHSWSIIIKHPPPTILDSELAVCVGTRSRMTLFSFNFEKSFVFLTSDACSALIPNLYWLVLWLICLSPTDRSVPEPCSPHAGYWKAARTIQRPWKRKKKEAQKHFSVHDSN